LEGIMAYNIDSELENADWTKKGWDLPEYKSPEFYEYLDSIEITLKEFKKLPVYKHNLAEGNIKE
jgi:hypothetical protein